MFVITDAVEKEITNRSIDLTIDYSQVLLSEYVNLEAVKEIPFVKTLVSFYQVGSSVSARNSVRNIITFFTQLHSNKISDQRYNKFLHRFNTDLKYKNSVIETVVLINERVIHVQKSKILANILTAHIEESVSWNDFNDLAVIIDSIHPRAIIHLKDSMEAQYRGGAAIFITNQSLLIAAGLASIDTEGIPHINILGKLFYKYGILPLEM